MNRRTHEALRLLFARPLAMHPRYANALALHVAQGYDDAAPVGDDARVPEAESESGVLVLPIRGTVVHHWTDAYDSYGLVTPTETLVEALDRAEADDAVTGVVLDIDSGGGMAAGTPEAAERIFRFRESGKPIVAVANSFAASAAYYLGAAAGAFYVTPSGEVGSIGTLMMHEDASEFFEKMGLKIEILRASEAENKARVNPFEPLSDKERAHAIAQLDTINARFLSDVERFRGFAAGTAAELSGNGRTFLAEDAVSAGLVDGIRTLGEVLAELEGGGESDPIDAPPLRSAADGLEVRSLEDMEVRAAEGAGALVGTALKYGSRSRDLGGFVEEFAANAFADSLASDDLRVLWQHDGRYVFGRVRAGTARIWSDATGLHYEATPPDAHWARDAMESIRRGDVTCNSFAFKVEKGGETWARRDGTVVRTVTKARLYEVGPQTNPAYEDTTVAVRGLADFATRERAMGALELRRRRLAIVDVPRVA